ncbi:peptidoglycan D,D-transpeptidase FtsI family protein [Bifidobacterium choloepi]|uniref:Penicillin-binding protein 2 n=1 Tax=Bifidobacterium choloepi TaxID=2614131 RepID=A0A6I5NFC9_9BIFI|nr:penicillin-binding protein 2 [Bifidobacterium choloepi]NEG70044.1 penicillin-binding protein 2 [Bifidobacterium choloepi]
MKRLKFLRSGKHGQLFNRTLAVGVVLALMAVACFGQLINVQIIQGTEYAQAATDSRTLTVTVSAKRGKITDVNGVVLAQSVERYTIIGNPTAAQEFTPTSCSKSSTCQSLDGKDLTTTGAAAVAQLLAPLLDMDATTIGGMLSGTGQYVVLAKDVTPEVKRKIDDLNLGGIVYGELSNERLYSNGTLMGALLGGVDADGNGVAGLEQLENSVLTGTDGYETYQQGLYGEEIPGTLTDSKAAVDGSDVTLTIDRDVQWRVEQILQNAKTTYNAAWGIAVVQDVETGEIRALADTDSIEAGSDDAKLNVAKSVSETFEPGSIGKVFTMSGLIQEGLHKMSDKFTVPNTLTLDGQTYKDAEEHATGQWTLAGILEQSSNVGTILASSDYTDEERYEYLTKFGIGQKSGLELPGESQGVLGTADSWDGRTRNTILFGQGYSTNALQLTNAIAVIANGGVKTSQKIVKSTTSADGHVTETASGSSTRVVDEDTAKQVMNAMESVAEHYEKFAGVTGYRVAAKSGTAEVAGSDGTLSSIISDYTAIIPADNPKFVVTVVLKDPEGSYGGLTAGPVFAEIGTFLMQKYSVPTSSKRTDAIPTEW